MPELTPVDLAAQMGRLVHGQRIDTALLAIAETLARVIVTHEAHADDVLAIVNMFMRRALRSGPPPLSVADAGARFLRRRRGEPDPDEVELEDLL